MVNYRVQLLDKVMQPRCLKKRKRLFHVKIEQHYFLHLNHVMSSREFAL